MIASATYDLEKRIEALRSAAAEYRAATRELAMQLPPFLRPCAAKLDMVLREETALKIRLDSSRSNML
jgi:hypothetical protein